MLRDEEIAAFRRDGYAWARGAISPDLVAALMDEVSTAVRGEGDRAARIAVTDDGRMAESEAPAPVDLGDPATWTRPVVRVFTPVGRASHEAARSPALAEAYDQLLGSGRWVPPGHIGGTVPVRFPHPDDPGDAGWHCDAGRIAPDGTLRSDVTSRGRGLVCLVLLTDVGPDDAPTEVRVGSHADVPPTLAPHGTDGVDAIAHGPVLDAASAHRPVAALTGRAGDVALCHPFLVHRATWPHRGTLPRAIAQGGVEPDPPFALDGQDPSVVEQMILDALGGPL